MAAMRVNFVMRRCASRLEEFLAMALPRLHEVVECGASGERDPWLACPASAPCAERTTHNNKRVSSSAFVEENSCSPPQTILHTRINTIIMSSLPPVYIVSAARTPTGAFLGFVSLSKRGATDCDLTDNTVLS